MGIEQYQLIANDWLGLERIINDLTSRVITQGMSAGDSPKFAGLTLTELSGILWANNGVITGGAEHNILTELQGGTTDEFYHLTSAEYSALGGFISEEVDPVFSGVLAGLTPDRLIYGGTAGVLTSVANLASWIAGMSNQVTVTDDTDGTITLSLPQNIHTGASPTFADQNVTDETKGYQVDGTRILSKYLASNIFVGPGAGNFTMTGLSNTIFGSQAFTHNTTGSHNFALGTQALWYNTEGEYNVAIGRSALTLNTTGSWNTGIGDYTLYFNLSGIDNIAIGASALLNSTGDENTSIGVWAGNYLTTGSSNVFIGFNAGKNQTTNSNRLIIDNQDRTSAALEITNSLIYGVFDTDPANQSLNLNAATIKLYTLSGLLKGTSGVVSAITDNSATWNTAQPGHTNLTSLAGLTYASASFVKMTSANTFTLDTNTYLTAETDTLATVVGRGANAGATINVGVSNTLTLAAGSITDSSGAISFNNENLSSTGKARFDGGLGIGDNPSNKNFYFLFNPTVASTVGIQLIADTFWNGSLLTNALARGINFISGWQPADGATNNRTITLEEGGVGLVRINTTNVTNAYNYTITTANCFNAQATLQRGASHTGAATITTLNMFKANNPAIVSGTPTVTNLTAFYDAGMTLGTSTNWGLGINTTNNYINGSLSIGKATAPTVPLDVVGAILNTTTIEAGTGFKCGGTAAAADGTYANPTSITIKGGIITAIS